MDVKHAKVAQHLCALANHPEGGRWPRVSVHFRALNAVYPAPNIVREKGELLILPARAPTSVDGTHWILGSNGPVEPNPEQLRDLLDAFGDASLDDESVVNAVFAESSRAGMSMEFAAYGGGARECMALGTAPMQTRTVRGALLPAACAAGNEAVAFLKGGRVLADLLDEVLVNAVGHRSYAPRLVRSPIRVSLYVDAIHISSPGGLPRRATNASGALVNRWSRNRAIMGRLRQEGRAHEQGRTLPRAADRARRDGWDTQTEASSDAVVVRILAAPPRPAHGERLRLPEEERRLRVLRALGAGEPQTARSVCDATGLPNSTVRSVLDGLVKEGTVAPTEASPRSPRQAYRLTGAPAGNRSGGG